ncbi:DUF418 domain-containing protein [Saccharibacillus kuerlensis]|uniref:DUF418 domain-containing protein n=1 Tax=Saccharibacillus kuerlensis TaxID=459527 RepID=A0ABQ2KWG1_9BACL|nr:DUF418 domain-containing protein [Saccharibacillus kuerlensis]GGN94950.1 hypothetical protein GCM10010969_10160 [Saccharibacillus kuerlensis]
MSSQKEELMQPMSLRERIHFLDIVRGFAMLGIIIVNYFLMVDSAKGFEMGSNDVIRNLVSQFAEGKFVTLFSFLFGVGFMIFMNRALMRVKNPNKLFARRLTVLLGFGLLHITLVWVGDILAFYALTGFLLLAFYKCKPKTVLHWIIALIAIQFLFPVISFLFQSISAQPSEMSNFADFVLSSHNSSLTYLSSIGARWLDMKAMSLSSFSTVYSMLLMYLLGVYFVKMEFFKAMFTKRQLWMQIWIISTIAFVVTESSSLFTVHLSSDNYIAMEFSSVLMQNGGLTGSMFYMSTLAMMLLYVPRLQGVLMIFTKVGRMSLTCYLLHSIIGTILLLGYGFGLANRIQPIGTLTIALAVYLALTLFSTFWLKRFKYGPMEFVWRKLTYGKVKEHSKTISPPVGESVQ